MTDQGDRPAFDLEARIAAAKARHGPDPRRQTASAFAKGTRYAAEIAVATVVGGAIGWFLDDQFGTRPWLAILFLLLGLAAGFRNLLRAVEREAEAVKAAGEESAVRAGNRRME
ncbi:AtpZ/AtpI family protein [Thermaurantiacus sp.]